MAGWGKVLREPRSVTVVVTAATVTDLRHIPRPVLLALPATTAALARWNPPRCSWQPLTPSVMHQVILRQHSGRHGTFHRRELLATSLSRQLNVESSNQVYLPATSPPPRSLLITPRHHSGTCYRGRHLGRVVFRQGRRPSCQQPLLCQPRQRLIIEIREEFLSHGSTPCTTLTHR